MYIKMKTCYSDEVLAVLSVLHILRIVSGCTVNLCLSEITGIECTEGSVALIQHVTCLVRRQNCDEMAYRDIVNACSGKQLCVTKVVKKLKRKYCSTNSLLDKTFGQLSVLYINYACVASKSIDTTCKRQPVTIDISKPYVMSSGYPLYQSSPSLCRWRIQAKSYEKVDIRIRDYRVFKKIDANRAYVRLKEKNTIGKIVKLLSTTKEDSIRLTLFGEIDIVMLTVGRAVKQRLWLQYRVVDVIEEDNLEPFIVTNQTRCGPTETTNIAVEPTTSVQSKTLIFNSNPDRPGVNSSDAHIVPYDQKAHNVIEDTTVAPVQKFWSKENVIVMTAVTALILPILLVSYATWRHKSKLRKYWLKKKHHKTWRSRCAKRVTSPSPVPSHCTQMTECDINLLEASDYALLTSVSAPIDFSKYVITAYKTPEMGNSWVSDSQPAAYSYPG